MRQSAQGIEQRAESREQRGRYAGEKVRESEDQNQLNELNDLHDPKDLNHLNDLNLYPLTFFL
jgi:hypothetical protein